MSENAQFDSLLGGSENLPSNLHLMQFTAARKKEIQAMKQSLLSTSKGGKLIFQKLPKHMRRRVMSHNAKRLPRRLREIHLNQLKKSGMPPKQKRPSRKFRRRPKNLMDEYTRRRRRCKWLETHIWHAKRFHMVEKWGYKLPHSPCDKAFRACYRASSKHCLVRDISYVTCLEIRGEQNVIVDGFKAICDPTTGLSVGAKAFIRGNREGQINLFKFRSDPKESIGVVDFNWIGDENRALWIWVHAAHFSAVLETLLDLFKFEKQREAEIYVNKESGVVLSDLRSELSRFRLTGPLSQAVLERTLRPIGFDVDYSSEWLINYIGGNSTVVKAQIDYWKSIANISSPAQLSPHVIISLIAVDPRYNYPKKRTKATSRVRVDSKIYDVPDDAFKSAMWSGEVRRRVNESKVSNAKMAELRSRLLVPGSDLDEPGAPVPYILIQRPGDRDNKLGYCSGWDVIVPSGWAQATWITLIMWGARAGGLRESESMRFELGKPADLAPDTDAGKLEDAMNTEASKNKYFRLPPNKRTNFIKFSIVSPFTCNWETLLGDWSEFSKPIEKFHVLRDNKILRDINDALSNKRKICNINVDVNCIVPVRLKFDDRGKPKRFAIICLPRGSDVKNGVTEPLRPDGNQLKRKEMRDAHKTLLKRLRRQRVQAKRNGKIVPVDVKMLADYRDEMRRLWLPENVGSVRRSASREVVGFVTKGDFSFTVAQSAAVGYIVGGAIPALLAQVNKNKVLVRNTTSRQYRSASLEIIL